jgi:hypothetical protein
LQKIFFLARTPINHGIFPPSVTVWGEADKDPRYADLDSLVAAAQSISTQP